MFNLKNAKTDSPANSETRLEDSHERQHSLENESHGTVDWLLRSVRKNDTDCPVLEGQLKSKREGNVTDGRLTEGQLDHHKSPEGYVPQRGEDVDDLQMKPLDALNAAQYAEQVKAFNDAAVKDGDTALWDRYIGSQLEGSISKVPSQVKPTSNQLQNQYERLKSVPSDAKQDGIKKMVMASIRDADALLFFVYHKAASENRDLNEDEKVVVADITSDKSRLASNL